MSSVVIASEREYPRHKLRQVQPARMIQRDSNSIYRTYGTQAPLESVGAPSKVIFGFRT